MNGYVSGALVDFSIQITLMTWSPDPTKEYVFYIISGPWGLSDGIWQAQINGISFTLFFIKKLHIACR